MRFLMLAIVLGFPFLEAAVLFKLGEGHAMWVIAWLVLAALIGVALIKEARFALLTRLAAAFAQGQFSLAALIDSGRTVLAGLLLIFPGVISDCMALVLLLLPIRQPDLDLHSATYPARSSVINGEFRREV